MSVCGAPVLFTAPTIALRQSRKPEIVVPAGVVNVTFAPSLYGCDTIPPIAAVIGRSCAQPCAALEPGPWTL